MPWLVNGQVVPEQVIREESDRLARDAHWNSFTDERERSRALRSGAESSASERILIEQVAANDPRRIDPDALEQEVERLKSQSGCRSGFDDALIRPANVAAVSAGRRID
jgi:hypothetical protein